MLDLQCLCVELSGLLISSVNLLDLLSCSLDLLVRLSSSVDLLDLLLLGRIIRPTKLFV